MADQPVSIFDYFNKVIADLNEKINTRWVDRDARDADRVAAQREELKATKAELEKRLAILNEYKAFSEVMNRDFMNRKEVEQIVTRLEGMISSLADRMKKQEDADLKKENLAGGRGQVWGWVTAGLVFFFAAVYFLIRFKS